MKKTLMLMVVLFLVGCSQIATKPTQEDRVLELKKEQERVFAQSNMDCSVGSDDLSAFYLGHMTSSCKLRAVEYNCHDMDEQHCYESRVSVFQTCIYVFADNYCKTIPEIIKSFGHIY